jgi:hypothetical protein
MKFKRYLQEEYVTGRKSSLSRTDKPLYCEVYKNPTFDELKKLHNDCIEQYKLVFTEKPTTTIRFIFYPSGDWYASTVLLLHSQIAETIKKSKDYAQGFGIIKNNTLYFDGTENLNTMIIYKTLEKSGIRYHWGLG